MPDAMWERLEGKLPKFRKSKKGGRPRLDWRPVLDGIFYILRTGCQWKALPPEFGSGSSAHRYFQLLVKRGLFRGIWMMALEEYDDLHGLDWEWQSMDGAMTKAPLGGEKNRAKPHGSSETRNEAELVDRRTRPADWARRLRSQHAR
jgi:transposase